MMHKMNLIYQEVHGENVNLLNKYIPILLLELFLLMGYILYRFGPWTFPYKSDTMTFIFVLSCQVMLFVGYHFAVVRNKKPGITIVITPQPIIKFVCIINALLFFPYCYYRTGSWHPQVFTAISDLAAAYTKTLNVITQHSTNFSFLPILFGLFSPFFYSLFPLIYFYWEEIDAKTKIFGVIVMLGYFLIEICTGKNYGIAVWALISVIILIAKYASKKFNDNKIALYKSLIFTVFLCSFAGLYFYASLSDRSMYANAEQEASGKVKIEIPKEYAFKPAQVVENKPADVTKGEVHKDDFIAYEQATKNLPALYKDELTLSYIDTTNKIFSSLPENFQFFYALGSYYVSHGYYGLTLALKLPFDWCYGVGHLTGVRYYLQKFGIDIYPRTYEYKLNSIGYPAGLKWITAYTQFASDFTFPGTVILMGLFGYLLALLWLESLNYNNPISILLLTNFAIQFIFFTSWWQAGLTGSAFLTFYGLLFLWILIKVFEYKVNRHDLSSGVILARGQ